MKKAALLFFLNFLVSCGGGFGTDSKGFSISASFDSKVVDVKVSDRADTTANLTLSVSSSDILGRSVSFNSAVLTYRSFTGELIRVVEQPLNFSLKAGEKKTVSLVLFSFQDKLSSPYIDLLSSKLVNAGGQLATALTLTLGQGQCHTETQCQTQNNQQVCNSVQVCEKAFSGTFPQDLIAGTCKVVAGQQVLQEKDPGILTGDGSGVVSGRTIRVSFNSGVPDGVYVVATCLSPVSPQAYPLYFQTVEVVIKTSEGNMSAGQISLRVVP